MALGENEKAVKDFDDAIRLEPANSDYYFKRGVAYERMGNNEKAALSFASALEFNEKHEPSHRHMADVQQSLGNSEMSNEHRQKARELAPPK
jgi:Tfp pilus assembly protein PilF